MEWPAGLVEKMGYADTIYNVLVRLRQGQEISQDEDSTEYQIVKTWLDHVRKQARKRKHG